DIGDKAGISYQLDGLGSAYFAYGDFEKSIHYLIRSLDLTRELEDLSGEAYTLHNLGNVNFELGNYESSLQNYNQALNIFIDLEDKRMEANVRTAIGIAHFSQADYTIAKNEFLKSIDIFNELKIKVEVLKSISYLILCQARLSEMRETTKKLESLEERISDVEEKDLDYVVLWNISLTYELLGVNQLSAAYLEEAYNMLMSRVNQIKNDEDKRRFLNSSTLNKEIIEAWNTNSEN
ncbi:MAG: tetratricopeptide repeat protein, partial [Melioribacteraceae bacterium]|nr:tetratricopeptide repeat protein [Melioribacteraceae bacterium]